MERNHLDDQGYIADLASRFREFTGDRPPQQPARQAAVDQEFTTSPADGAAADNPPRRTTDSPVGATRRGSHNTPSSSPAERDRHSRKCLVCNHPDRDAIDQAFVDWHLPRSIAKEFRLPIDSVYRHAHAIGLFPARGEKVRECLAPILEQAETCQASANDIINAVKVMASLTDDGKWIRRPRTPTL
jgi:hypothetical protein